MKLKEMVNESWLEEKRVLTREEKREFLEKVGNLNQYGEAIHSKYNLIEIAKELSELAKSAEVLTLAECDESFDKLTVQRNMKELRALSEQFAKSATEAHTLKTRVGSLYEDMCKVIERYYKINDLEEVLPGAKAVPNFTPNLKTKGKETSLGQLIPGRQDEEKLAGAKSVASGTPALPEKGTAKKQTPTLPGKKSTGDETKDLPKKGAAKDETKELPRKGSIGLKSLTPNLPK